MPRRKYTQTEARALARRVKDLDQEVRQLKLGWIGERKHIAIMSLKEYPYISGALHTAQRCDMWVFAQISGETLQFYAKPRVIG